MARNLLQIGAAGQEIIFSFRTVIFVAVLLALVGCNNEVADTMQSGRVVAFVGLNGRWAGPVTPAADDCGKTSTGLMTIGGGTFAFDPFQSTTVVKGKVSDDGNLSGTMGRPVNGQAAALIAFTGAALRRDDGGETVEGRLVSGRCSWKVILKRG